MNKLNTIELDINKGINEVLSRFDLKLKSLKISHEIDFTNSGNKESYFSEIEVTFWENDNILDVISVVIYADGNLRDTKENFCIWFENELKGLTSVRL